MWSNLDWQEEVGCWSSPAHRRSVDAGLELVELVGVEGQGWLLPDVADRWTDEAWRELLLFAARAVETEVTMRGASAHLLAVARRPSEPSTG